MTKLALSVRELISDGILCCLWNMMNSIVQDILVKITCYYFESNKIEALKRILYQCNGLNYLGLHPIRQRNGPNKDKNNIDDVLYALHECSISLPTFVVSELASLTPMDINNVDFAHIL